MLHANHIFSNTAAANGGGIYVASDDVTLSANELYSNTAWRGGAVSVASSANARLCANDLRDNLADDGGGVHIWSESDATLDNNVIVGNRVSLRGSAVSMAPSRVVMRHNTIARNTGDEGAGVYALGGQVSPGSFYVLTMTNNIVVSHTLGVYIDDLWTTSLDRTLWATETASANVTAIENHGTLTHRHDVPGHPHFVDPDNGDCHIGPQSAALDRGPDSGVYSDKDGVTRPQGAAFDLGAHELLQSRPVGCHTRAFSVPNVPWR
jgi:predicted outer membrane repeat protein